MMSYYGKLCVDLPAGIEHPMDLKLHLAYELTKRHHGQEAADKAKQNWLDIHRNNKFPSDCIPVQILPDSLISVLYASNMVKSSSEARRLIAQNAIKVNDEIITNPDHMLTKGTYQIRVGKKRFLSLIVI